MLLLTLLMMLWMQRRRKQIETRTDRVLSFSSTRFHARRRTITTIDFSYPVGPGKRVSRFFVLFCFSFESARLIYGHSRTLLVDPAYSLRLNRRSERFCFSCVCLGWTLATRRVECGSMYSPPDAKRTCDLFYLGRVSTLTLNCALCLTLFVGRRNWLPLLRVSARFLLTHTLFRTLWVGTAGSVLDRLTDRADQSQTLLDLTLSCGKADRRLVDKTLKNLVWRRRKPETHGSIGRRGFYDAKKDGGRMRTGSGWDQCGEAKQASERGCVVCLHHSLGHAAHCTLCYCDWTWECTMWVKSVCDLSSTSQKCVKRRFLQCG